MSQQEIGELRKLEILDLSDNQVENIPDEICGCEAMTHLTLAQNYLQHLPRDLGELLLWNNVKNNIIVGKSVGSQKTG